MQLVNNNMKWIMLVSGVLTLTMIFAFFSPQAALTSMFGVALKGPLAELVVRNWGALIALIGGMLIYGAFNTNVRQLVLIVAGLSKLVFITLVLVYGFGQQLILAISFDAVVVVIFIFYLVSNRREHSVISNN